MEKIPTVDISWNGKNVDMDTVTKACTNLGVFQIENHGISLDLMDQLMDLSKTFFNYPIMMKIESTRRDHQETGAGYNEAIDKDHDFEYLLMYSPETSFNGVPSIPDGYRQTFDKAYKSFLYIAQLLEKIINHCLGLPPNVLSEYNDDRSEDYLIAMRYPPSTEIDTKTGDTGIYGHQDPNVITIVLQDEVSGLEVFIDGDWIPIIPTEGKLLVVIGDIIQDLSNKKFRNVTHRALRHKGEYRHAIDFCYSLQGDKLVKPLPEFTDDIGVKPKYREFVYKDYIDLISKDDKINLTYYEI